MYRQSPKEQLDKLLLSGKRYDVSKGEIIYTTDDKNSLYLIAKGYVKRYQITNRGSISIQYMYGPQDVFPLTAVVRLIFNKDVYRGPDTYFYEAMNSVTFYKITGEALIEAIAKDPLLYKDILSVASERFLSSVHQLENVSLPVYYQRVAHQLWYYTNKFSERAGDMAKITVPLTHQDLADVLSTTRETVSICMSKLAKDGVIKPGRNIIIPDVKRLQKIAYS